MSIFQNVEVVVGRISKMATPKLWIWWTIILVIMLNYMTQLMLRWWDYPSGPDLITKACKRGAPSPGDGRTRLEGEKCTKDSMSCAGLKMEGTVWGRMWVVSRRTEWPRADSQHGPPTTDTRNRILPRTWTSLAEEPSPAQPLILALWDPKQRMQLCYLRLLTNYGMINTYW